MTKRILETKQDDYGLMDKVVYEGCSEAVWIRRDDWKKELRMPVGCKACGVFMKNWDTQFFNRSGVCSDCHINYIEGRDLNLNSHAERVAHCKALIEEKQRKKSSENS